MIQPPLGPPTVQLALTLIDRRIEQYKTLGYSRELMLQQMLVARLPLDALRTRFPEFPEGIFRHPENPTQPTRRELTAPGRAPVLPSVANPSVDHANQQAVMAAEGISFQYVPLIQ